MRTLPLLTLIVGLAAPAAAEARCFSKLFWGETKPDCPWNPIPVGYDRIRDFTGGAALDGVVEVPLYRGNAGDYAHHVEVALPDGSLHLFRLTAGAGVHVSEAFAGETGVKVKKRAVKHGVNDGYALLDVPALGLGDLTLSGITATVGPVRTGEIPVAGELGLGAFRDLAVAILPSEGVVRFAPADQGAALLAALDGAEAIPYRYVEAEVVKHRGEKKRLPEVPFQVDARIGGEDALLQWDLVGSAKVGIDVLGDATPLLVHGTHPIHKLPVALGGLEPVELMWTGTRQWLAPPSRPFQAWLPTDLVVEYDVAWDPATQVLALRYAETVDRATWSEPPLAKAREAVEGEADEADAATGGTASDVVVSVSDQPAADDPKKKAGALSSLGRLQASLGAPREAEQALRDALDLDPETCATHHDLGQLLLEFGEAPAAQPHLETAAALWKAWDALPLKERKELEARSKEDGDAYDGPRPQPASCHAAEAQELYARIGMGQGAEVVGAWRDGWLSTLLPAACGIACLVGGHGPSAEAAWVQVGSRDARAGALGLAAAQRLRGDLERAEANIRRHVWDHRDDLQALRMLAEVVTERRGAEAASVELTALAAIDPRNATWQLAAAEALHAAGADPKLLLDAAIARFERELDVLGPLTTLNGQLAAAYALAGRADDARHAALHALAGDPGQVQALDTLTRLAELEGNAEAASAWRIRLARAGVQHPGFVPVVAAAKLTAEPTPPMPVDPHTVLDDDDEPPIRARPAGGADPETRDVIPEPEGPAEDTIRETREPEPPLPDPSPDPDDDPVPEPGAE